MVRIGQNSRSSLGKQELYLERTFRPLNSDKFLEAALAYIEPLKGTYIYDAITRDYLKKTGRSDAGYGAWLHRSLSLLSRRYRLENPLNILDFGCGTGELSVLMHSLGYQVTGVDVHEKHLALARILAQENKMPDSNFILSRGVELPFPDKSFDIVTLFVVLEHLSDAALERILPELRRVCRGVIYVLVPNRLQLVDDHTGLRFIPWMPRRLAALYIKARGKKYHYAISDDGSWDVYYRGLSAIVSLFKKHAFDCEYVPDEHIYPSLTEVSPLRGLGKYINVFGKKIFIGFPYPSSLMMRMGYPKQLFYPYFNLIFVPRSES